MTYALAGLVGLALAMGVGRFAFTPLLPLMQSDAALTLSAGAWLAAANYLGYFVGALVALAVRGRPGTLIRAALVVTAASTLAMGYTHALVAWLAWRALAGVASAFLLVFIAAVCLERLAAHGRLLSALVFSGVGAGIFAVGILCLGLERSGFDSSRSWIVLGAISALLTIVVWPVFTGSAHTHRSPDLSDVASRIRRGRWRVIVCYGLFGFGYIIPATFLPAMAKAIAGDGWTFGLAWPAFGFAAFVSTFIAARLARTASGLAIWRSAQIAMAVCVALPAILPGLKTVIVAALGVGGTFMVITMVAMQTAKEFAAAQPRRLMAIMTAAFAAGQLAGPLAVWFAGADADFTKLLLLGAASLLLGAGLLTGREMARPQDATLSSTRKG